MVIDGRANGLPILYSPALTRPKNAPWKSYKIKNGRTFPDLLAKPEAAAIIALYLNVPSSNKSTMRMRCATLAGRFRFMQRRMDLKRLELTGPAAPVVKEVVSSAPCGFAQADFSQSEALVYVRGKAAR